MHKLLLAAFSFLALVAWRLTHHPASLNALDDVDALWYWQEASQLLQGQWWGVNHMAPFPPGWPLLLLPGLALGLPPNLATLLGLALVLLVVVACLWRVHLLRTPLVLLPLAPLPVLNCFLLPWSEVASLPLILLFVVAIGQRRELDIRYLLYMGMLAACLIGIRWANVYWLLVMAMHFRQRALFWTLPLVVLAPILLLNYWQGGSIWGMPRVDAMGSSSTMGQWVWAWLETSSWLVPVSKGGLMILGGMIVQFATLAFLIKRKWLQRPTFEAMAAGVGYVLWLAMAERVTEVDMIDARLLSPALVVWLAGTLPTAGPDRQGAPYPET